MKAQSQLTLDIPYRSVCPLNALHPVQNAAVRLIFDINLWNHVTPGLRQLHGCKYE